MLPNKNKKILYANARKSVIEYVKSRKQVSTRELNKFLLERYKFNSNQIAGLLHKMSTSEKLLEKIDRGIYTVYDHSQKTPNNDEIIKNLIKTEKILKDILAESITNIDFDIILELKDIITSIENLKDKLSK